MTFREFENYIKDEFLYNRFNSLYTVKETMSAITGVEYQWDDLGYKKSALTADSRIICNMIIDNDDYGVLYVDLYYLKDNYGDMFITDFMVTSDYVINLDDEIGNFINEIGVFYNE